MKRVPSLTKAISNTENLPLSMPVLRKRNSSNNSISKVPPAGAAIVKLVRKREEKFESKVPDTKISPKEVTPAV